MPTFKYQLKSFILDICGTLYCTSCSLEVHFLQLWLVSCAGCTVFCCFWQTSLCKNFGQQFFRGPMYLVNPCCLLSEKLRMNIRHTLFLSYFSVPPTSKRRRTNNNLWSIYDDQGKWVLLISSTVGVILKQSAIFGLSISLTIYLFFIFEHFG